MASPLATVSATAKAAPRGIQDVLMRLMLTFPVILGFWLGGRPHGRHIGHIPQSIHTNITDLLHMEAVSPAAAGDARACRHVQVRNAGPYFGGVSGHDLWTGRCRR